MQIGENPLTRKEISARYYEKNKEQIKERNKAWTERNYEQVKTRTNAWIKNNPEKVKTRNRKRRALKRGNDHIAYTEQECLDFWGSVCYLCNKEIDLKAPRQVGKPGWRNGLHFDHVVPLSKGGPDQLNNVRPSHGGCNTTKHVKETVA